MAVPPGSDGAQPRREHELSSLYASARALAAIGEVDEVLGTIVRQAREVMGSDLAYLSVLEGESLRMRSSAGVVSVEFSKAEVSSTTGIGGRVIGTRAPAWVSNYLSEPSMERSRDFDTRARDEGLVALLGVPLVTSDRVVGVLFVADREERPFSPDEVALLSALGDLASVALQNARLYEESRSALARLREAYRSIELSGQVHEALGRLVLAGGDEGDVATLLHEALDGEVMILDRGDAVLATHGDTGLVDRDASASTRGASTWQDALQESRRGGLAVTSPTADGGWRTVAAITTGDSYLGAIVWHHPREPTAAEVRTLERGSHILGLLTLKQDAVVEAEGRLRAEVLTELLRSRLPLPAELLSRGRAMNLDVGDFNSLIVVECSEADAFHVRRHLASAAPELRGLTGIYAGLATMALRTDDLQRTVQDVHRSLRPRLRAEVLVCGAVVDLSAGGFSRAYTLASRCLQVLVLAGVRDTGTTTTENGLYAALFDPERAADLTRFLDGTLGDLLRYDEDNGTALVDTLTAYFANNGNAARTAREMHLHANTLVKRLERVASVLGPGWNQGASSLPLQVALRLHGLRSGLEQGGGRRRPRGNLTKS